MKAARLLGRRDIRYMDVEKPVPKDDEVLIKVKTVGLCGTDLEMFNGTMPYFKLGWTKFPITLGHEWSGVIEEVGKNVTLRKIGDRVTGDVSIGCGKCVYCMRGLYNLCLNRIEVGLSKGKDGGYAEYLTMPEKHTYVLPDEISFEEAALTESTATVVKAIEKAGISLGDIVLVQGDGPIGLLALQAANAGGSSWTIVCGTFDEKLALAKSLGANLTVNIRKENLKDKIYELTSGIGVDFVIEASGKIDAFEQSYQMVKPGGKVCVIGLYEEMLPNFNISNVVAQDISLIGSIASPNAFIGTLRLMKAGKIKTKPLITHRLPLSEIKEGMRVLEEEVAKRIKIIMLPEGIEK